MITLVLMRLAAVLRTGRCLYEIYINKLDGENDFNQTANPLFTFFFSDLFSNRIIKAATCT